VVDISSEGFASLRKNAHDSHGARPSSRRVVVRCVVLIGLFGALTLSPISSASDAVSLQKGATLHVGQSLVEGQFLESHNGQYELILTTRGQLVLRNANLATLWNTNAPNTRSAVRVVLRPSGDLVIEIGTGHVEWSTRTSSVGPTSLSLQSNGNLVLRDLAGPIWSTRTGRNSVLPEGLRSAAHARQLIIISSPSIRSTHSWLTTWQHTSTGWHQQFSVMSTRDGENGWLPAKVRHEGDGTTPEGIFTIGATMYGNDVSPGVSYKYHRLVPGDYWDENPATGSRYNTFQHSANRDCADNPFGGDTECLWLETADYPYFAVVQFNTPARGAFGSAIFLHVNFGPSEGCVSVSRSNLVKILRWLTPADHPLIVLAGPVPLPSF
jgi:L,D-peptidoglycan transpeptidase YkuD (ErfK/YbiS/YcfS/YnhG family)